MSALFQICDIVMKDDLQKEKKAGSTNLAAKLQFSKNADAQKRPEVFPYRELNLTNKLSFNIAQFKLELQEGKCKGMFFKNVFYLKVIFIFFTIIWFSSGFRFEYLVYAFV